MPSVQGERGEGLGSATELIIEFSQTDKKITRDVKCVCHSKDDEEHVMDIRRS